MTSGSSALDEDLFLFLGLLLDLRRGDRHHDTIGLLHQLDATGELDVLELQVVADLERRDVQRHLLRDVARQALDLYLSSDEIEHTTLVLDPGRRADELDRDRHGDDLIHQDALKIDVQHLMGHRIGGDIANHGVTLLVGPHQLEQEDGVLASSLPQHLQEARLFDPDRHRLLVAAVDHGGDPPLASEATVGPFAGLLSLVDSNRDFVHLFVSLLENQTNRELTELCS